MKAAIEVFSENEYHRASMDEIALRAQVAKGTLYYNFPGKSQLFKTVVKRTFEDFIRRIEADLQSSIPLMDKIQQTIRHHLDLFLESRHLSHMVFNDISNGFEEDVLDELKLLREEHLNFLANILEEGKCDENYLRDLDSHIAAVGMLGTLESTSKYFLSHPNQYSRDDLERQVFTMITMSLFHSIE